MNIQAEVIVVANVKPFHEKQFRTNKQARNGSNSKNLKDNMNYLILLKISYFS